MKMAKIAVALICTAVLLQTTAMAADQSVQQSTLSGPTESHSSAKGDMASVLGHHYTPLELAGLSKEQLIELLLTVQNSGRSRSELVATVDPPTL
jgi:hypothetical protein